MSNSFSRLHHLIAEEIDVVCERVSDGERLTLSSAVVWDVPTTVDGRLALVLDASPSGEHHPVVFLQTAHGPWMALMEGGPHRLIRLERPAAQLIDLLREEGEDILGELLADWQQMLMLDDPGIDTDDDED